MDLSKATSLAQFASKSQNRVSILYIHVHVYSECTDVGSVIDIGHYFYSIGYFCDVTCKKCTNNVISCDYSIIDCL